MLKILICLAAAVAVHSQGQTQGQRYTSVCGRHSNLPVLTASPGSACKKPIGYNLGDPTQATDPKKKSTLQIAVSAIGMRIDVGADPTQIFFTAYPTTGVLQSAVWGVNGQSTPAGVGVPPLSIDDGTPSVWGVNWYVGAKNIALEKMPHIHCNLCVFCPPPHSFFVSLPRPFSFLHKIWSSNIICLLDAPTHSLNTLPQSVFILSISP